MDNIIDDRDALDTLRRFILKKNIGFATIKPEIEVQNGVVVMVRIAMGDVVYKLKPDEKV